MRKAGVPIGRTRCTRCGAEGVNRRTCTGDADTHARLAGEYRMTLHSGNQPSYNTEDGKQPPKEYDDEVDEVVDLLTGDIILTPPTISDARTESEPSQDYVLHQLELKVVTKYPLGIEASLLAALHEQEAIWMGTTFTEVRLDG